MGRITPLPHSDQAGTTAASTDAVADARIVDIAHIQPYERNPRKQRNPEYDRIKDSIRSHGLDQPLLITQRPGAADYIVQAGGNTRLLILKELYEETDDERFARIQCVYWPWQRESEVLLAHLRENDLRGNLTFIDKARAVLDAKQLIAEELSLDEISHRRLETELIRYGYRISRTSICRMEYAVNSLLRLIPEALEAGLGRHAVERMRTLERAARMLWQHHCSGGDAAFDEVFAALCRRYDGSEWDSDLLQCAIESEIAEEAESSVHTIRVELEAAIQGRTVTIPEFVPIKEPPNTDVPADNSRGSVTRDVRNENHVLDTNLSQADDVQVAREPPALQSQKDSTRAADGESDTLIDRNPSAPTDLKSLRGRAWTLAARLAQRNGIGDLIDPVSGNGLGFVLRDVPDPVLAEQLDEDALAQLCMLWWQLAACAEMTYAPLESILPLLPAESVLRRALADEDAELLFSSIWTLDPGHTGYRLWRSLPDPDWQDLLTLMDTYRRIRHLAAETGTAIWN